MKKITVEMAVKMMEQYRAIAGEAIALADEYAGGESETATELNKQFEKLEVKRTKTLDIN